MSHLNIETLARLVDEAAESHEAAHLDVCEDCRAELEGLRADAAALAALPTIEPSAAQWSVIEQRLSNEGLLRKLPRAWSRSWNRQLLQLAAAIVIFVLGYTAPVLRQALPGAIAKQTSEPAPGASVRNIANVTAAATPEAAALAVRDAEQAYLNALTRYTELAGHTEAADPVARLAALESIVLTTRAALGEAPADPVINGYHLTAIAQRDATLKQLASKAGKTWF